jgi:tape measure domain-containing protein
MISSDSAALVFKARGDTSHAKREFSDLEKSIDKNVSGIDSDFRRAGDSLGSFVGKIGAADIVLSSLSAIKTAVVDVGAAVFNYSSRLEQTEIGFNALLGNQAEANRLFKELQEFSRQTPFAFPELTSLAQRLIGANVELERVVPLIKDIGNIVAATGNTSIERLEGINTAITQIISKQKVQAEEMEQLAERGIPAWQILSEAIGKSVGETRKLAEQGQISSDILIAAVQKVSRERFGDALAKQAETFSGSANRIKNLLLDIGATGFAPLYDRISKLASDFARDIEAQGNDLENVGITVAKYVGKGIGIGIERGAFHIGQFIAQAVAEDTRTNPIDVFIRSIGVSFANELGITDDTLRGWGVLVDTVKGNVDNLTKSVGEFNDKIVVLDKTTNTIVQFAKQVNFGGRIVELDTTNFTLKSISDTLENMPSLDAKVKAKEAADQLKKVEDIVSGLINQIAFFGDTSAEAATKQQLINAGVYDFTNALAQNALNLARTVDGLNAAKKLQEDYNETLKEHRDTLDSFAKDALNNAFPDQSVLDRFNKWVKETKADMTELRKEVEITRNVLQAITDTQALINSTRRFLEFNDAIGKTITGLEQSAKKTTSLEEALFSVAQTANLIEFKEIPGGQRFLEQIDGFVQTLNIADSAFVNQTKNFVTAYREQLKSFAEASKQLDAQIAKGGFPDSIAAALDEARLKNGEAIDEMIAKYREFLLTLKTKDKDNKDIFLFADKAAVDAFIAQMIELDRVVGNIDAAERLKKEKEFAEELLEARRETLEAERDLAAFRAEQQRKILVNAADSSFGTARIEALRKLEQFDRDAARRAAINRAKDIDDEEKAALRRIDGKENEEQLKFEIEEAFRNRRKQSEAEFQEELRQIRENARIEIKEAEGEGFFDSLFGGLRQGVIGDEGLAKIISEADAIKAVYADLGATLGDVFANLTSIAESTFANFILTGKFGVQAFKQLAAAAIASIAVQAGVKALFEVAEGIKESALAAASAAVFDYHGAALHGAAATAHFAAAKAYGIIAGVAVAAGLAIGAAGGLGGGGQKGNQAVSSQTQGGFGSQTSRGEGGEVFTTNRDKQIIDIARNNAQTIPAQPVNVYINDKSGLFGEFFRIEAAKNGGVRDVIKKIAHG